jgi:hypothetical protein
LRPAARGAGGGRGHRRRPGPTQRHRDTDIADRELEDVVGLTEPVEGVRFQPDVDHSVEDGHGRGDGAAGPHGVLDLRADPSVVRAGQAVGEDRALQRNDAPAAAQRVEHLVGNGHGSGRTCHVMQRTGQYGDHCEIR